MFNRKHTHFTLVAAALCIAAHHARAITIPIAIGSPGTTINEFSIPFTALNGQTNDGTSFVLELVFDNPVQVVASDPSLTTESGLFGLRLIHPFTSGDNVPELSSGELIDDAGEIVGVLESDELGVGFFGSSTSSGSLFDSSLSTVANQDGLVFQGVRLDLTLSDNGETITGGQFSIGIESPASLLVVPEPGSLALLGIGGLLVAQRRPRRP